MVRYVFEAARRPALLSGDLTCTLRALGRKRHARIGETITLAVGAGAVATAVVVCRGRVILNPRALLRVLDIECLPTHDGTALLLRAAEQGGPPAVVAGALPRLALRLGFPDWEALYGWTAAHGLTAGERLWREFIAWSPASITPVQA